MKSLAELEAIKNKIKNQVDIRRDTDTATRIVVGMATCGIAAGARSVLAALVDEIGKRNISDVTVSQTGCMDMCRLEPIVEIFEPNKERVTYVRMTEEKARKIISEHIVNGNVVTEFTIDAADK